MPLYDFECPHGHRFEHLCSIAEREESVPCEGKVNELVTNDDLVEQCRALNLLGTPMPEPDLEWIDVTGTRIAVDTVADAEVTIVDASAELGPMLVRKVPCKLKAKLIIGKHNNPGGALDHGLAANRDAAREGRYDPANPNRKFMAKGRSWRK
jgi:hypothetical protein